MLNIHILHHELAGPGPIAAYLLSKCTQYERDGGSKSWNNCHRIKMLLICQFNINFDPFICIVFKIMHKNDIYMPHLQIRYTITMPPALKIKKIRTVVIFTYRRNTQSLRSFNMIVIFLRNWYMYTQRIKLSTSWYIKT